MTKRNDNISVLSNISKGEAKFDIKPSLFRNQMLVTMAVKKSLMNFGDYGSFNLVGKTF